MMWRFLPKNTRVEQPSRKTHLLDMSGSLQSPVGFYLHAENNCGRAIANLDFIFWACQSICPDAKESRHCSVCLQQQTWECGGYVEDHREVNKIYRFKSGNQILLLSLIFDLYNTQKDLGVIQERDPPKVCSHSPSAAHHVSLRATITRIMSGNHRAIPLCPQNTVASDGLNEGHKICKHISVAQS